VLAALVDKNLREVVDADNWETDLGQEEIVKDGLQAISENWEGVLDYLELPA
jgi:hypothetical protein